MNPTLIESQLLARERDCALASLLVAGLPNSVLVQLVGTPLGGGRRFSLYSVYREETITFDAIYRFAMRSSRRANTASLGRTLQKYVSTADFRAKVLEPLIREVEAHFGR